MTDTPQLAARMEHAYARGDLRQASALAREIKALPVAPDEPAQASAEVLARAVLQRTRPDAFLLVVGMLGLGLTVWLVYNYVL